MAAKMESISRDEFITHRDQVLTGLTTIMRNIQDFYHGFVYTTNTMLHGENATMDAGAAALMNGFPTTLNLSGKPRKQREKKIKDPNAPKKPLTAFFLFQQSARPIVAQDLGNKATPKDVADETQRRWADMSEEEKQKWKDRYQIARTQYVTDFEEYTKKQAAQALVDIDAHLEDDDEHDDEHDVHAGFEAENSDHDEEGFDEESEEEEDDEPAPPPPPPTKAVKASKKKANGAVAKSPSPSSQLQIKQSPIPVPGGAKDNKRKRKDDTATASTEQTSPKKTKKAVKDAAEKEKKDPKRKRKSDIA